MAKEAIAPTGLMYYYITPEEGKLLERALVTFAVNSPDDRQRLDKLIRRIRDKLREREEREKTKGL